MSQIFYLGPSFYFINSRKLSLKKYKNVPIFYHKIRTKALIKDLRHASLEGNVIIIYAKFQYCEVHIK